MIMHNLIEFLESTYTIYGDKTAVKAPDDSFTFAELRQSALQTAIAISTFAYNAGGKQEIFCSKERIAVYLPKGAKCLCAMLSVLYCGNAYVPLDSRSPVNRIKLMIEMIQPRLVVTDEEGKSLLLGSGMPAELLAEYDELASQNNPIPDGYAEQVIALTQDVDPAYILFTSGSTGLPKGVVIPHRRIINYINWACDFFSIGSDEVIGNQAPFYFTVSAMDIYLSLATGSKLCIIPEGQFSRPEKLLRFLNDHEITLIFWVSSVYHHVAKADALSRLRPQFLKHAWFVGEPMSATSLSYWLERLPDVEFANLYGSTETDMTICYRIPKGAPIEVVPLGQACANTEILLLKDDLSTAKPGEIGEICTRGSCLASGYYQNPERTGSAFFQNPLHNDYMDILYRTGDLGEMKDGLIYFHGRRDHQFKHLGYRIEAGEIEAIAARYDVIKNACVIYDGERQQIVLFYEAGGQIDELAYRRALMEDLPVYMIPTRFVRLEAMPFNANRKKDKILLKAKYIENEEGK